jgi:hypothetical protein
MPESLARFLLKRRWIIRPGLESTDPHSAVDQYLKALSENGRSIQNSRILVFGYGGRFAVGVELLKRGAAHVVLCDHFVLLDNERNLELLPDYEKYLVVEDGNVHPRSEYLTLVHGDIRIESVQNQIVEVDMILSTSVFEHLDDVDGITAALAGLTKASGVNLHFVDLRDHYFKYPFEMLAYSDYVWKNFLNPTSNLNRFRMRDYRSVFERYFQKLRIDIIAHDQVAFEKTHSRIRQEFLSGDIYEDSVTLIQIFAEK